MIFPYILRKNLSFLAKFNLFQFFFQIIELNGPLLAMIQNIFKALRLLRIIRWILLGSGIILMGMGAQIFFRNRKILQVPHNHDTLSEKSITAEHSSNDMSHPKTDVIKRSFQNPVMTGHEFDRYRL